MIEFLLRTEDTHNILSVTDLVCEGIPTRLKSSFFGLEHFVGSLRHDFYHLSDPLDPLGRHHLHDEGAELGRSKFYEERQSCSNDAHTK